MAKRAAPPGRLCTGIEGLDEVLLGGLLAGRAYLVRGGPGSGKTTLGMHFLSNSAASNEKTLFINLGESEKQLRVSAKLQGFDLSHVTFLDLSPAPEFFSEVQSYDIFSPADVEREPTTRRIVDTVEDVKPKRVFVDAVTHLRYLSPDPLQFRKQTQSLLRYLVEQGATVVYTSEDSEQDPDDDLQYMADGILQLSRTADRRTVEISKYRGSDYKSGAHLMIIDDKGISVFPKLMPEANSAQLGGAIMTSGIPELDEMLHGGLERGTVTFISGPSGVGKTTLALQFMKEAASRGEKSAVYSFEEGMETILHRSKGISMPLETMVERGTLRIFPIEPLHYAPDEFAYLVRRHVDEMGADIVMLDSISGYSLSIRGDDLVSHMHSLVKYLQNRGVTVLVVNELQDIIGDFKVTEIGLSYMADTVLFLRYLEYKGELRRVLGVLKKRLSDFEKTLREFRITPDGLKVGKPLTGLRGILTGIPEFTGDEGMSK